MMSNVGLNSPAPAVRTSAKASSAPVRITMMSNLATALTQAFAGERGRALHPSPLSPEGGFLYGDPTVTVLDRGASSGGLVSTLPSDTPGQAPAPKSPAGTASPTWQASACRVYSPGAQSVQSTVKPTVSEPPGPTETTASSWLSTSPLTVAQPSTTRRPTWMSSGVSERLETSTL